MFRFHDAEAEAAGLVSVVVTYVDGILKVSVDATNSQTYEECFSAPVRIPGGGHLGLTASTGHLADNHDVFQLKFTTLDKEHTRSADYDMHDAEKKAADEAASHSDEELEEINKAVNNTGVVQVLHEKTKEHAAQLEVLHSHLNQRLSGGWVGASSS
jgi:hypothetical protein